MEQFPPACPRRSLTWTLLGHNESICIRMIVVADERCDLLCLDLPLAEKLRRSRLELASAEAAAARAGALADPTRLLLASSLREGGELCVCDLAWVAERPQNLVSHHLRRLRGDGLVQSCRDGKMVLYSLTEVGRALLSAVLDVSAEVAS